MLKFGIELEGFLTHDKTIIVPDPHKYSTDSFVGLIEFRSAPSTNLYECVGEIQTQIKQKLDSIQMDGFGFDFKRFEHVFTREQLVEIRKKTQISKSPLDIQNLYGKTPRYLGNRKIASCQINISQELTAAYTDSDNKRHPATYGLLDIPKIVRALDEMFEGDIKASRRQPGFYAIKDNNIRLEYRSLPNYVFCDSLFQKKVLGCLKS